MNIYPYITIVDSSINRENLQKSQNKIFPINGTQLYTLKVWSEFEITSKVPANFQP